MKELTEREFIMIERFFHYTTETFDDWYWDGTELTVWLKEKVVERYLYSDIKEFIKGVYE